MTFSTGGTEPPMTSEFVQGDIVRKLRLLQEATKRSTPDREALALIGRLLHAYCLDEVDLADSLNLRQTGNPEYEARSTQVCSACASIYIGTKAGLVRRLSVRGEKPVSCVHRVQPLSNARAILHLHPSPSEWDPPGPCLLVGTDDGQIHVLYETAEDFAFGFRWSEHDETAQGPAAIEDTPDPGKNQGITALCSLEDPSRKGAIIVLAAQRNGVLRVLAPQSGGFTVLNELQLKGWVQWLSSSHDRVSLVTRQGDEASICASALLERDKICWKSLGLQPSAALRLSSSGARGQDDSELLCLGTQDGLYFSGPGDRGQLHAPVTRSPVLCLAQSRVHDERPYLALGLDSGRVLVIERDLLEGQPEQASEKPLERGRERPRRFSLPLGSAVLAIELLSLPEGESDPRTAKVRRADFLFVALRNHYYRLFRIEDHSTWITAAHWVWRELHAPVSEESELLNAIREEARDCGSDDSMKYLLLDAILPNYTQTAPTGDRTAIEAGLSCRVDTIKALANGASAKVVQALSSRLLRYFQPSDVDQLIISSMNLLQAAKRRPVLRWRAFVERHLDDLRRATLAELDEDRLWRAMAWMRVVRKYLLLGYTFSEKDVDLRQLSACNQEARKHFDSFIYGCILHQRRHDLDWKLPFSRTSRLEVEEASSIVAVAEKDGTLKFFDLSSGEPLDIEDAQLPNRRELKLVHSGARVLSLTAWHVPNPTPHLWIAAAWLGTLDSDEGSPRPVLAAVALARDGNVLTVKEHKCIDFDPQGNERPYALRTLAEYPNVLFCGTGSSNRPLWFVDLEADQSTAEPLKLAPDASPNTPAVISHGARRETPSRWLAVITISETCQLVAVGNDNGEVSLLQLEPEPGQALPAVRLVGEKRFHTGVSCLELIKAGPTTSDRPLLVIGTTSGDVFCFELVPEPERSELADNPCRRWSISDLPLWRDYCNSTPVRILVPHDHGNPGLTNVLVSTLDGHVSFYEGGRVPFRDFPTGFQKRLVDSGNYRFAGFRYDRIALGERLLAIRSGGAEGSFVAHLAESVCKGRFCYLRNTEERKRHSQELNDKLSQVSLHQQIFRVRASADQESILRHLAELCDIEDGALRVYLSETRVREALSQKDGLTEFYRLLTRLDPYVVEDRNWIKALIRQAFRLSHFSAPDASPEPTGSHFPESTDEASDLYVKLVGIVSRYATADLATVDQDVATRLQAAAVQAIVTIDLLKSLAREENEGRASLRNTVDSFLGRCLSQDERFLRFEALRAIGVALRDAGFSVRSPCTPQDQDEAREQLFPQGFESVRWIVDLLIHQMRRYRPISGIEQAPTPWTSVAVLAQIVRLFPAHCFYLCHLLSEAELGQEVLRTLRHCLQGELSIEQKMSAYERLWPTGDTPRDDFPEAVNELHELAETHSKSAEVSDGNRNQQTDGELAHDLFRCYSVLAELWTANHAEELPKSVERCKNLVADLTDVSEASIARPLALWLRHTLAAVPQLPPSSWSAEESRSFRKFAKQLDGDSLAEPARSIVAKLSGYLKDRLAPQAPKQGDRFLDRTLGRFLSEGMYGIVFEVEGRRDEVVKVFWRTGSGDLRRRQSFEHAITVNQLLYGIANVVKVRRVETKGEFPAFSMERCSEGSLLDFLDRHLNGPSLPRQHVAYEVAAQLTKALHEVHGRNIAHRDLSQRNVLVHNPNASVSGDLTLRQLQFKLCDFDRAERKLYSRSRSGVSVTTASGPSIVTPRLFEDSKLKDLEQLGKLLCCLLTEKEDSAEPLETLMEQARGKLNSNDARELKLAKVLPALLNPREREAYPWTAQEIHQELTGVSLKLSEVPYGALVWSGRNLQLWENRRGDGWELRAEQEPVDFDFSASLEAVCKEVAPEKPGNATALEEIGRKLRRRLPQEIVDALHQLLDFGAPSVVVPDDGQPWELIYIEHEHRTLGESRFLTRFGVELDRNGRPAGSPPPEHKRLTTAVSVCFQPSHRARLDGLFDELGVNTLRTLLVEDLGELSRQLAALGHFDLLHIYGHHDPGGFPLASNLSSKLTASIVRDVLEALPRDRRLVIFNGCSTAADATPLGNFAQRALIPDTLGIGTLIPVETKAARRATVELLRYLRGSLPLGAALRQFRHDRERDDMTRLAYVAYGSPHVFLSIGASESRGRDLTPSAPAARSTRAR